MSNRSPRSAISSAADAAIESLLATAAAAATTALRAKGQSLDGDDDGDSLSVDQVDNFDDADGFDDVDPAADEWDTDKWDDTDEDDLDLAALDDDGDTSMAADEVAGAGDFDGYDDLDPVNPANPVSPIDWDQIDDKNANGNGETDAVDDDDMLAMPKDAGKAACAAGNAPVTDTAAQKTKFSALTGRRLSLRAGFGAGTTVDRAKDGAIRNVSIMQVGPAKGHGFTIDNTMLRQVADQMATGVPMRFTHPDGGKDALGTHVGKVVNAKLDGSGVIRGDIEFGKHAKNVPGLGNVAGYLLDLAEDDPKAFGLSVVFDAGDFELAPDGTIVGRSAGVDACDLTADPAANPAGLV